MGEKWKNCPLGVVLERHYYNNNRIRSQLGVAVNDGLGRELMVPDTRWRVRHADARRASVSHADDGGGGGRGIAYPSDCHFQTSDMGLPMT